MEPAREEAAALRDRVGRLPGFPLLLGAIAICMPAGVLLPADAATAVGFAAPALLLVHAWCRPTRRGDYASAVIAPACVSALLHDLLGVPRWTVALPVALLALAAVWGFDAERRASRRIEPPQHPVHAAHTMRPDRAARTKRPDRADRPHRLGGRFRRLRPAR